MTTFQANLLCKPLLFIPSSSSFRLSPSRSLSTFTPVSLSSPKPPITLCSLNPNHNNAYFTFDSSAEIETKRLALLLADADANPYNARKQSALLIELNKHSPESVIKRFEQGGHMVDARCLVEYIRALALTGAITEYLPDVESRALLQELKNRASGRSPLHARTVDPKASKKSTTYEKLLVFFQKKGLKLEYGDVELIPNPESIDRKYRAYAVTVEFIKTPEFDAKQLTEEVVEFIQNPKVKQVTEEVVELIKNPKFDAKQVREVAEEFLKNPKAKKKLVEVVEFIKNPEFDAKQAGEFLKNPKAKQEFEELVEFIKYPPNFDAFEAVDEFLKNPKAKQKLEGVVEYIKSPNFEPKLAYPLMAGIFIKDDPKGEEGQFEKLVEMIKDPKFTVKQAFEVFGEFFNDPKNKQAFEEGVEMIKKTDGLAGKLRLVFFVLWLFLWAAYQSACEAVFSVFLKLKILFLAICGRINV